MNKAIYFDMDGTIADFYGNDNWLADLQSNNARPYKNAKPLLDMDALIEQLKVMQNNGWKIGIVSWLSKASNRQFDNEVIRVKKQWLNRYLKGLQFDDIQIVSYGIPKSQVVQYQQGILFDDELPNRNEWENNGGIAFNVGNILTVLEIYNGI